MADSFDVVVIGAGPGGYAAAIRCAQKGASTAIIEKKDMGGTCLNVGCIPSKSLLASAHFLLEAKHCSLMGLELTGEIKPNWKKMQSRKDAIVAGFTKGVTGLIQSNKIKIYNGRAIITEPGKISVEGEDQIQAKNIIIATGSEPINIPAFPFDYETIISSEQALSLQQIPQSMVIIGGGVIGCEMACVYAAVGCKVTIIEALDSLLPNEDPWVGQMLAKEFKKLGITSMTSRKVASVAAESGSAKVSLQSGDSLQAEKVLVAVGRKAVCDKETVQNLSLDMDGPKIKVNEKMETNAQNVYAVGDAVGTTYLAHGAFQEAEVAAENATGNQEKMGEYNLIPRAVYTFPEVASIGLSEKKCAQMGIETEVGKAAFRTNGRSVAHNQNTGEVRVIRDKKDGSVVGVTMVGATVTEMLAAARALIGSKEKITEVCFPHPTVSEVLKEAWEDAYGMSIHVPPRKR